MSGDASGKPTPSYKEILRSKDKAVSEANTLLKGERKNRKKISISRKNIVPLGGWRMWGERKKLALGKRRAQDTNTAEYGRKNRTPLLDDIQPNERCYNRLIVAATEESLVAFVNDGGFV